MSAPPTIPRTRGGVDPIWWGFIFIVGVLVALLLAAGAFLYVHGSFAACRNAAHRADKGWSSRWVWIPPHVDCTLRD